MIETKRDLLPLSAAGSGCACCGPAEQQNLDALPVPVTIGGTSSFQVSGMTCGHCTAKVSRSLSAVDGVTDVRIDLVPGGMSTVTVSSDRIVPADRILSAVKKAGYLPAGS